MEILLVEPFFTGSHKAWAEGLKQHSTHSVTLLTMSGHHWKWRMHGGAITLAKKFSTLEKNFDLILCSDMLDLGTFQALTRIHTANIPFAIYFHENQIMYPRMENDRDLRHNRDHHYGFINYSSALCADHCLFNSGFHRDGFLQELPAFLKGFPDQNELLTVEMIRRKSSVLPLALDLGSFNAFRSDPKQNAPPILLWNHRWEYDKDPESFFNALFQLKRSAKDFQLVVLGENFSSSPDVFEQAKKQLEKHILHWGTAATFGEYASWLWRSDIQPVTSIQEFFGISVVEAIYCETIPLLPDRLSYPELAGNFGKTVLYKEGELVDKLEKLLTTSTGYDPKSMADHVKKYDWSRSIEGYDKKFEEIKKATGRAAF